MIIRDISNFEINGKEKRDAYHQLVGFINSDACYDGKIAVVYGLRRTGKTILMEQAMVAEMNDIPCLFLLADKNDSMDTIYSCLDDALDDGFQCVFIDEITEVSDFIDNSAYLADYYAKEGLRVVIAGTDSLSFLLAEGHSLFDRAYKFHTTYISFAEHCRVLGTKDVDDYIEFGGFMARGRDADGAVYDYKSACKYLDDAVSDNISRSIKKNPDDTYLYKTEKEELRCMIEKLVEIYSGAFHAKLLNEELKKIVLTFPTGTKEFKDLEGIEIFQKLKADKPKITQEFITSINADTKIIHKLTDDAVHHLENLLIELDFLSATNAINFFFTDEFGWRNSGIEKDFYLIQSAIKYSHLQKALNFIESKEYYNSLSVDGKRYFSEKLSEKIHGDMIEQIVLYDTAKMLSAKDYFVLKPTFKINSQPQSIAGEYEMLVSHKADGKYWAFEIKHTTEPYSAQAKHLENPEFRKIIDYCYGDRQIATVLYRGDSFQSSAGIYWLNIADFLLAVDKLRDMDKVMKELTLNLPQRDLLQEEQEKASSKKQIGFKKNDI